MCLPRGIDTQPSGAGGTSVCTCCGGSGCDNGGSMELPEKAYKANPGVVESYVHTKKVGNYLISHDLGSGSFATVKEALHVVTGERVAIKVIDKETAKTDAYVSRNMRREGRILQLIRHSNIVQLLEVMETENCYYLVLELCQGGDLMTHLVKRRRLTEAETRRFLRQIVQAVGYMHSLGILHRDLKIENLLLTQDQNVKIIDFGLSNLVRSLPDENGSIVTELCRTQCGSPAYAAPEVLAKKPYGTAVDIWSIGVNMFAMLTGNLPFTVKPYSIKALYQKMVNQELNPLPKTLSVGCRDLLMRLLNPEPETRIKLKDVMSHPWLNENVSRLRPSPFPNLLTRDDLRQDVLHQTSQQLLVPVSEVARKVLDNSPSSCLATYLLLAKKADRYCRQNPTIPKAKPQVCSEEEQSTKAASSVAVTGSVSTLPPESNVAITPSGTEAAVRTSAESRTPSKAASQAFLPRREKTFAGSVPLSSEAAECSALVPLGQAGARDKKDNGNASLTARQCSLPKCTANPSSVDQPPRYHRTLVDVPEVDQSLTPTERWADRQQTERTSRMTRTVAAAPVPPLRRVGTDLSGRASIQSLVTQRYSSVLPPAERSQQTPLGRGYQVAAAEATASVAAPKKLASQQISATFKIGGGALQSTVRRFSVAAADLGEFGRR